MKKLILALAMSLGACGWQPEDELPAPAPVEVVAALQGPTAIPPLPPDTSSVECQIRFRECTASCIFWGPDGYTFCILYCIKQRQDCDAQTAPWPTPPPVIGPSCRGICR